MKTGITVLMCVVIILVIVSFLCHVIALATNVWLTSSSQTQFDFLHLGLFSACFDDYIHQHEKGPARVYDGCHGLYSDYYSSLRDWLVPGWLSACRVVAIIALILQLVGILLVVLVILWVLCKWLCCDRRRGCCDRCLIYTTPIIWILAGVFLMSTVMLFADNAFRLQCRDFWVGGEDPNDNRLAWSWGFEVAACIFSFITGGFTIWLVVLKARDDI